MNPRLKREGWWAFGAFLLALAVWGIALSGSKPYLDQTLIAIWGGVYFLLLLIRVQIVWLSGVLSKRLSSR